MKLTGAQKAHIGGMTAGAAHLRHMAEVCEKLIEPECGEGFAANMRAKAAACRFAAGLVESHAEALPDRFRFENECAADARRSAAWWAKDAAWKAKHAAQLEDIERLKREDAAADPVGHARLLAEIAADGGAA